MNLIKRFEFELSRHIEMLEKELENIKQKINENNYEVLGWGNEMYSRVFSIGKLKDSLNNNRNIESESEYEYLFQLLLISASRLIQSDIKSHYNIDSYNAYKAYYNRRCAIIQSVISPHYTLEHEKIIRTLGL